MDEIPPHKSCDEGTKSPCYCIIQAVTVARLLEYTHNVDEETNDPRSRPGRGAFVGFELAATRVKYVAEGILEVQAQTLFNQRDEAFAAP